jgi:hypothetical protein
MGTAQIPVAWLKFIIATETKKTSNREITGF